MPLVKYQLNLNRFPAKGTFDFPVLGENLTRDKLLEKSKTMTDQFAESVIAKGFKNVFIEVKESIPPKKESTPEK